MGREKNVVFEMNDSNTSLPILSSQPPATRARSPFIAAKLAGLRRKVVATEALTGVAMAAGVGVEALALAMFADWALDLAWGARLLLLVAQLGILASILLRLVARPLLHQPDDDRLALMVEKGRSIFRSRLIASVQLAQPGAIPPGASVAMAEAMVAETEAIAAPLDFNAVVSTDKLKKLGALAATVLVLGLGGYISGGVVTRDLLKRAFLSSTPVPRKTRITVVDGNKIVGRGDSVRLEVWVKGVIPSSGKLEVKYRGRRSQEFSLERDRANRQRFGRTIDNVQDSFTYAFYLNDGQSPTYQVRTIARPTVLSIECDQEYPAYTKLKPTRRSLGDLSLLAGSRLNLRASATKPIQAAGLKFTGAQVGLRVPLISTRSLLPFAQDFLLEAIPLEITGSNRTQLSGTFTVPAKGLAGFTVAMLDTEGMESRDSALYRVETIPDRPPTVRITYPDRKEELITRQATMPVAFEASDDFQITKLRLRFKVDTLDEGAEKAVDLDLEGENPQRLKRRHEWNISAFRPLLPEGSKIEYWIEAQDNNDATGSGIGSSEHQFAKVVSESEKRADLLNRAGDYLGSINDVASDQEKLNQRLGTIIREQSASR